jgi:hypothetical protein
MGSLLTTSDGGEITGIANGGAVFLDFVAGTITLPEGSTGALTRTMNKNLNDLGLNQCNSIAIWCSDADATYQVGSALSLSDHQLSHIVNNYGFSSVRIDIPSNSTPSASNQIFFMGSTDGWMGYSFPRISHQRSSVSDTSSDTLTTILSKHVGAYNQFLITTSNTGGTSIDLTIEFSEDGTNWFADSGYTTAVSIASGSYNAFASEVEHHFYRARVVNTTTGAGHASAFTIHWNFVNDRGSAAN